MTTYLPAYEDKFIAFIDVLGFKSLVERSEQNQGFSVFEIEQMLSSLGTKGDVEKYKKYGPMTCPESSRVQKDLSFMVTQISDCAIISCEVSPAGVVNLISHCWGAVMELLAQGIMCRGYITRGMIYHTDSQVLGTGYNRAYANEATVSVFRRETNERGTPFVEVDPAVTEYIDQKSDECVRKMFDRMVRSYGDDRAIYPFSRLSHSFTIAGYGSKFDPVKEKKSNATMRQILLRFRQRVLGQIDPKNPSALRKAKYYVDALDEQIALCDQIDKDIDGFALPFPRSS